MAKPPKLQKIFQEKPELPNKYSEEIGERMKAARIELGLTQEEMAKQVYKRRASLSNMENGKMLPDIFTLMFLSNRSRKSVDYFLPEIYRRVLDFEEGDLNELEKELISQFRRIKSRDTHELIISQVKATADYEKTESKW